MGFSKLIAKAALLKKNGSKTHGIGFHTGYLFKLKKIFTIDADFSINPWSNHEDNTIFAHRIHLYRHCMEAKVNSLFDEKKNPLIIFGRKKSVIFSY